jgi:hypothetical protein
MATLNSADEILALKHSVKNRICTLHIKKGKGVRKHVQGHIAV